LRGVDDGTYETAARACKDAVFAYAALLLGDPEEARDVAQESLVRLWQRRAHVPDPAAARAWLFRTAHNLCLDRVRRGNSRAAPAAPGTLEALAAGLDSAPDRKAFLRETAGAIGRALEALKPRDRGVLLMREVHGLTYEEMAEVLSIPLGTLKAIVHRARERLRDRLIDAGVRP